MAILWAQRNTHTALSIQLTDGAGNALDLTGVAASSIMVRLRPYLPISNYAACTGTTTISSPPTSGIISYQFSTTDVSETGQFYLNVEVDYGSGNVATGYETVFVVTPA